MENNIENEDKYCPRCKSILSRSTNFYFCTMDTCMFRWNINDFDEISSAIEMWNIIKNIDELEELSNKIRYGTPVSFQEAIAVVEYQSLLKKHQYKNKSVLKKVLNSIKKWINR